MRHKWVPKTATNGCLKPPQMGAYQPVKGARALTRRGDLGLAAVSTAGHSRVVSQPLYSCQDGQVSAGAGLPYQVLSWPNSWMDSSATLALIRQLVAAELALLPLVRV